MRSQSITEGGSMHKKKIIASFLTVLFLSTTAACSPRPTAPSTSSSTSFPPSSSSSSSSPTEPINPTLAIEDGDALTIDLKSTFQLTVTATDIDAPLRWESSNPSLVDVDQNGLVTAYKVGSAVVTVYSDEYGLSDSILITVIHDVPVKKITLAPNPLELMIGESGTISANITPFDATDKTLTWSTSNPSVATVDDNGYVTSIASGSAEIIAKASNGVMASCTVYVSDYHTKGLMFTTSQDRRSCYIAGYIGKSTSLVLPASYQGLPVVGIVDNAFKGMISLRNVFLPESLKTIGSQAFWGCTSLETIQIPKSVVNIEADAFQGCSSLVIYCESESLPATWDSQWNSDGCPVYWSSELISQYYDFLYRVEEGTEGSKSASIVGYNGSENSLTIPNSISSGGMLIPVKSIAEQAFQGSELEKIVISEGIETIGAMAFQNCLGLSSVTLPSSLSTIDSLAFSSCRSLTSLTLPKTMSRIGEGAFLDCAYLSSISFPTKLTKLEEGAFQNCSSLESVSLPSLDVIPKDAFRGCSSLETVIISDSIREIQDGAFANCFSLSTFNFTSSL